MPVTGARLVHGYGVDLTARKRTELALARATREAEAANQAKSEVLAALAKDLRAPVKEVIAMAELLAGSGLANTQRAYTATIENCAAAMLRVIDQFLSTARLGVALQNKADVPSLSADPGVKTACPGERVQ